MVETCSEFESWQSPNLTQLKTYQGGSGDFSFRLFSKDGGRFLRRERLYVEAIFNVNVCCGSQRNHSERDNTQMTVRQSHPRLLTWQRERGVG